MYPFLYTLLFSCRSKPMPDGLASGADVGGCIKVDGILLEYRARLLSDGAVSVGTIFKVQ
jgi:hypothetical protein